MKNASGQVTHPVTPRHTSRSHIHCDNKSSISIRVSSGSNKEMLSICRVCPPLLHHQGSDTVPSHLTMIFMCCQQRFVFFMAEFDQGNSSSFCMNFFDSKYCFRQWASLSRLPSHTEIKNSSCCNEKKFLMFSSSGVPEIPGNQPLQS